MNWRRWPWNEPAAVNIDAVAAELAKTVRYRGEMPIIGAGQLIDVGIEMLREQIEELVAYLPDDDKAKFRAAFEEIDSNRHAGLFRVKAVRLVSAAEDDAMKFLVDTAYVLVKRLPIHIAAGAVIVAKVLAMVARARKQAVANETPIHPYMDY